MNLKALIVPLLLAAATLAACSQNPSTAEAAPPLARPQQTGGSLIADRFGAYPRLIRLVHSGSANGTVLVTFDGNDGQYPVYRQNGSGWTLISTITDASAPGQCCTALFELPAARGDNPAGTLLFATVVGKDTNPRTMSIRVWKSTTQGSSWSLLSTPSSGSGGLWEPEFFVDSSGDLELFFADETQQSTYSQTISRVVSTDGGATWGSKQTVLASGNSSHRPGMPEVVRLNNGSYLLAFEWCGRYDQYECAVYTKTSSDGSNWGSVTDFGTRPTTPEGHYARSTPYLVLGADPDGSGNGRLLLNSEILYNSDGSSAAGSGRTVLMNTNNGSGSWIEAPTPVEIPAPDPVNWCPNYSSPILPSVDGSSLLEVATDWPDGTCKPYFATGLLVTGAPIGSSVWLRSSANNLYASAWLDLSNAPVQARGGAVDLWEKFTVVSTGGGPLIALRSQANQNYVSAWITDVNAPLGARSSGINAWEKFEWRDAGNGQIALKAYGNARFVSAWLDTSNAPLQAVATSVQGWELFTWGNAP